MSEQCCGTCQRWTGNGEDWKDVGYWCDLTGSPAEDDMGGDCRAYLEKGRETMRARLWVQTYQHKGEWLCFAYPEHARPAKLGTGAWAEVDVPLPSDPPTVEGFAS